MQLGVADKLADDLLHTAQHLLAGADKSVLSISTDALPVCGLRNLMAGNPSARHPIEM
jgi:hypothetical protein